MSRADLEKLSKKELIEAYLELQAKLQRPAKTSRTSSQPPSTDKKQRRDTSKPGGAKPGHKGASRRLADNPDAVVDHRPDTCGNCGEVFPVDVSETLCDVPDCTDTFYARKISRSKRFFVFFNKTTRSIPAHPT